MESLSKETALKYSRRLRVQREDYSEIREDIEENGEVMWHVDGPSFLDTLQNGLLSCAGLSVSGLFFPISTE
jgi:hypothetical protein